MRGWKLHRSIGVIMRPWRRGYWPLAIWFMCDLVSLVLYGWAGVAIQQPLSDEFFWFFGLIAIWSTIRLCYEYWLCGWTFLWLFKKDRLEHLYKRVQNIIIHTTGSEHLANVVVVKLRRKVHDIRQIGPRFRKRFTIGARAVGYIPLFGYGLTPGVPKFPVIALCRTLRWETGLFFLALGNAIRVGPVLGGLFGTSLVVRWFIDTFLIFNGLPR